MKKENINKERTVETKKYKLIEWKQYKGIEWKTEINKLNWSKE